MTDYEVLKAAGHSAFKAGEMLLDAKRGDPIAIKWIAECRKKYGDSQKETN